FLDQMRLGQRAPDFLGGVSDLALDDDGAGFGRGFGHGSILFCLEERAAAAALISAFSPSSSIGSPSRMSIARRVEPSRLELNRPLGSSSEAPLAKVSFTSAL